MSVSLKPTHKGRDFKENKNKLDSLVTCLGHVLDCEVGTLRRLRSQVCIVTCLS